MSTDPPRSPTEGEEHDEADDAGSLDFLRDIARVDDRPPPSMTERLRLEGTNIGRFKVVSEIGRGGMGIVLLAEDEALRRKVALKLLPPSFATDEERRRRFLREARAAAAVSHPNLVTVFDVGEHEGRAYIAMEYVRGRSLREMLSERPLGIDEAVELARQILAGLAHAHAAGLLHRDLKPENVLVEKDGRVRLVDFGLAKLDSDIEADGAPHNSTRDGLVMGTPGYMSPEQARGQTVDARSDIFSFGVLFYELLTKKRPFAGPTRADILSALLRDEPERVSTVRPEICASLADVVARCLAKAPDDRYPSTTALSQALDDAWAISKTATPDPERSTGPTRTTSPDGAPPKKRRRVGFIPPVFGLAAAIALAFTMHVRSERNAVTAAGGGPVASASGDGGARGIAITDLPLPKSSSMTALASYKQAVQAIRDADWSLADDKLRAAVVDDPELSLAYLRLAIIAGTENGGPLQVREDFARAMSTRAALSERDQAVMMAIEPMVTTAPMGTVLHDKLEALTKAYPKDAEIWHLYALFGALSSEDRTAAEREATTLDPQFADAWQILGKGLAADGHIDEALSAIDKCIAISPLSADCRGERANIHSTLGDCTKMEDDLRRGLESNPRPGIMWQDDRAASLLAVGRGDDTVLESFRQKWAHVSPPERRKIVEYHDRALLAFARGRFAEAEGYLLEGEKLIVADQSLQTHADYAGLHIESEVELGHPAEAAKIAQSFLAREDLWIGSQSPKNPEMPFTRVAMHGGLISPAEYKKRRDAWWTKGSADDALALPFWAMGWAYGASTAEEAKDALAIYDRLPRKIDVHSAMSSREGMIAALLGHVLHLAGRNEEALPALEGVSNQCDWLHQPWEHTQWLLELGQAHEALGHTENACEAYQRVIARWAGATKSVTLDIAKARAKALMCGAEARRSPPPAAMSGPHIQHDEEADDDDEAMLPVPSAPPKPPATPSSLPSAMHAPPMTMVRVGVVQGAERDATCKEAKHAALSMVGCSKTRSVEGNCECNQLPGGWLCKAVLAVTCN